MGVNSTLNSFIATRVGGYFDNTSSSGGGAPSNNNRQPRRCSLLNTKNPPIDNRLISLNFGNGQLPDELFDQSEINMPFQDPNALMRIPTGLSLEDAGIRKPFPQRQGQHMLKTMSSGKSNKKITSQLENFSQFKTGNG